MPWDVGKLEFEVWNAKETVWILGLILAQQRLGSQDCKQRH